MGLIHVSGMGLLGSFIAWELFERGVAFTWDDNDSAHTAWRACTGSIVPCDDGDESLYAQGYRDWRDVSAVRFGQYMEPVSTLYMMKSQPGRVKTKLTRTGWGDEVLWRDDRAGWQFDAEQFVHDTREQLGPRRQPRPNGAVEIRARGVAEMLIRPTYVWGWRVRVRGTLPLEPWRSRVQFTDPAMPVARFYLYPIVGDPSGWWGGSSTVLQKQPTVDSARAAREVGHFARVVHSRFPGMRVGKKVDQGWRPKPRRAHALLMAKARRQYTIPVQGFQHVTLPLYKSGVQSGPLVACGVVDEVLGGSR